VASAIIERKGTIGPVEWLVGGFYKYKWFEQSGDFDGYRTRYSLGLNLYSVYLEAKWHLDANTMAVTSLKYDAYRYNKDVVSDADEWIGRIGYLKRIGPWYIKLFYVHSYLPVPMFNLYSDEGIPYATNPHLETPTIRLATAMLSYQSGPHSWEVDIGSNLVTDKILYEAGRGYVNSGKTSLYQRVQGIYTYTFDRDDSVSFTTYVGKNGEGLDVSPRYGAILRLFKRWGQFDWYHEFNARSGYYYDISKNERLKIKGSLDYTASVKYHINEDFMIGVRGENLFSTGFKQAYRGIPYAIPVYDRKFWINLEYLF
jgi:iron complex outermembrane receptor protein